MANANQGRLDLLKEAVDIAETLHDEGKMEWISRDQVNIAQNTSLYIDNVLEGTGISFEVAKPVDAFYGSFIFRLNDPLVGFLHHDPIAASHAWIDKEFKLGLRNWTVFNYFMARKVERGFLSVQSFLRAHQHRVKKEEKKQIPPPAPASQFARNLKFRRLWELRAFEEPKKLVARGNLDFLTEVISKQEAFVFGSTHFIMHSEASIDSFLQNR